MNERDMINAFMRGLVQRAGGLDAAGALIGAQLGGEVHKGTISKRLSGQLDWPLVEIMALEDAVGDPCVRRWLSRSLTDGGAQQDIMQSVASVLKEHGEAMGAALAFASGRGSLVDARKEVAESRAALRKLAAILEERAQ